MSAWPRFTPVADHALLVEFASQIAPHAHEAVLTLDRALMATSIPGLVEVVPAFVSLLVDFDPLVTDHVAVESGVRAALEGDMPSPPEPAEHVVQASFGPDEGPDLAAVAASAELPEQRVVELFLAGSYRVAMYGFAPGYAYLMGVDEQIQVPRKAEPVRDVPAGSIIIAGPQCLVTTVRMPTGWSIIGRSPTRILRPDSDRPFLFDPGDRVRFTRV
ncbi:5-oxoprolinase subunit B family protein [Euzebya tangerina]|uniref:5-oxoprolinase subunit B family protein n=1 Tax=Euzebya tangerina TaxID=591198 RepID=UPI000E31A620|nr:allophanate hydrolase subunit 1 [Euzebya tangerina]